MMGKAPTVQERRVCEDHWATVPEGAGGWLGLRVDIVPNSFREKLWAGQPLPASLDQCPRSPRQKIREVSNDLSGNSSGADTKFVRYAGEVRANCQAPKGLSQRSVSRFRRGRLAEPGKKLGPRFGCCLDTCPEGQRGQEYDDCRHQSVKCADTPIPCQGGRSPAIQA